MMLNLDKEPSVGEFQENSRPPNYSPFSIHGHVTERKKQARPCISNAHPIADNLNIAVDQNSMLPCGTGKASIINKMGNQMPLNVASHPEPFTQPITLPAHTDKVGFKNDLKPEETLYDTDMELTASELGEIFTIKSKTRDKSANIVKANKTATALRKVRHTRAGKMNMEKDNNKPKTSYEKNPNNEKIKSSSTVESKKIQSKQTEQFLRTQERKLISSSEGGGNPKGQQTQSAPGLHSQQKTVLEKGSNKDFSRVVNNAEYQDSEQDVGASIGQMPLKYCIESLSPVESQISAVMASKHVHEETTKQAVNINKSNYCEMENAQYLRKPMKECESRECKRDCRTRRGQNLSIQNGSNQRDVNGNSSLMAKIPAQALGVPKPDNISMELLQAETRRIVVAKASRKTYIIHSHCLTREKRPGKQESCAKNAPHITITSCGKKVKNTRRTSDVQNVTPLCLLQEGKMYEKTVESISNPRRKMYVVCSSDQGNSKEKIISNDIITTVGVPKIPKSAVLKNFEILPKTCQEKNEGVLVEEAEDTGRFSRGLLDSGMLNPN